MTDTGRKQYRKNKWTKKQAWKDKDKYRSLRQRPPKQEFKKARLENENI